LPGYESRHNTKYWTGEAVYGFGCSAHSYDGARRRWANERDTLRYCELVEAGRTPVVETTELDESDCCSEAVFLGLRLLRRGVSLSQYSARFHVDLSARHADDLARLHEAGLISVDDGVLRLTRHGALLSNEVFAAFI
jgi:oxygen-independent coproporphyrinogen-3 oxidase